jgi:hypothetical protein
MTNNIRSDFFSFNVLFFNGLIVVTYIKMETKFVQEITDELYKTYFQKN